MLNIFQALILIAFYKHWDINLNNVVNCLIQISLIGKGKTQMKKSNIEILMI